MKHKPYITADHFFKKLLKDSEIKFFYEEERAKTEIAAAVKAARLHAKLTQAKLANKIGTTQSVIARLESGQDSRTPTLPLLAKIAAACKASLEFAFVFKRRVAQT
jgi:DNA-binding XRE family transcriptional regulator